MQIQSIQLDPHSLFCLEFVEIARISSFALALGRGALIVRAPAKNNSRKRIDVCRQFISSSFINVYLI